MIVGVVAGAARGSTLYGIGTGTIARPHVVSPTTGAATPLGFGGVNPSVRDLAGDWRGGSPRLWGTDTQIPSRLVSYDLVTGNPTVVGPYADGGLQLGRSMRALAFDGVTGTLFGVASTDLAGGGETYLYAIDPATAAVTLRGAVGYGTITALGFDLNGSLFAVSSEAAQSRLVRIDTASGAGSLVGAFEPFGVTDLAARPEDGTMFLVTGPVGDPSRLYTIDTATASAAFVTDIQPTLSQVTGMAFTPEPSGAVVTGVLASRVMVRRRRDRAASGHGSGVSHSMLQS